MQHPLWQSITTPSDAPCRSSPVDRGKKYHKATSAKSLHKLTKNTNRGGKKEENSAFPPSPPFWKRFRTKPEQLANLPASWIIHKDKGMSFFPPSTILSPFSLFSQPPEVLFFLRSRRRYKYLAAAPNEGGGGGFMIERRKTAFLPFRVGGSRS